MCKQYYGITLPSRGLACWSDEEEEAFRSGSRRPAPPLCDARTKLSERMINAEGENVDLYIPRKCSWTNRLITATDKASVQLNVGHLDANGVYSGQYTTVALSGYVRSKVR